MAAGGFYVRKNTADTSAIANAGGANEDSGWDTLEYDEGSVASYTDPNFRLGVGLYLIMYSEYFYTADVTNNERIEIQGEVHVAGVGAVGGYGSDYIRKSSGQQECVVSGYMILEVTSANTDVFVRFYRTDDSTSGAVNRVAGYGGVSILELDDANHSFGLYSTSASEATSSSTERTLGINTNDKQDAGFSRSADTVTITNAGRYLATYSLDLSIAGAGREVATGYIRKNAATEIIGTRGFSYLRSIDGCHDSALTWIGIIDVAASDALQVRWSCPTSATITAAAGATLQLWQIPSVGDEAIMEATTGDYNASGDFVWDTLPHIDTASFSATAGTDNITAVQSCHCLVFAAFAQAVDSSPQRAYPTARITKAGNIVDSAIGGGYHRNSSTSNFSMSVAGVVPVVGGGVPLRISTTPLGTAGALANTKGQFSVLSLESIWGYIYPPSITTMEDRQIDIGETNNVITGDNFGAAQGTGKVELWSDLVGTLKVVQAIDTWSATSIQFDSVQGALSEGTVYIVITSDGGAASSGYSVNLGQIGYSVAVGALNPSRYWKFQNTYTEEIGAADFDNITSGTPTFVITPKLCRGDTHAHRLDGATADEHIEAPDISEINTSVQTIRYMGGWIRLDSVQQALAVLYEEGAQVNNIAFLVGFGNILMAQCADTGDDYAQAYSDFKLAADRTYHIMFKFEASAQDAEFRLFIDGILQVRTNGNPWTATNLDAHSGNIAMGHQPSESLDVGGTDIAFATPQKCYYAHWANWSGTALTPATDIRKELFEKGAREDILISSDSVSAMQAAFSIYDNTTRPDSPMAFKVQAAQSSADLTLTATNMVFVNRISIHVQWAGPGTLTLVNTGTSNIDSTKCSVIGSGIIVVSNPAVLTVDGLINGGEVRIYDDDAGGASHGTELAGVEALSGTSYQYSHEGATNTIVVQMIAEGYEEVSISYVLNSTDQTLTVIPNVENNT